MWSRSSASECEFVPVSLEKLLERDVFETQVVAPPDAKAGQGGLLTVAFVLLGAWLKPSVSLLE